MTETEEYFPRGGKKPAEQYFKQSSNFLGKPERGERKRKRQKKTEGDDGYLSDELGAEYDRSSAVCAGGLNYKVVREGVLILGRVRDVQDTKVYLSLPCRMQGTVMACHVSEPYNRQLQAYVEDKIEQLRELPQMFHRGQYVGVRVLEARGDQLMLSMMPQHVNAAWRTTQITKGALLQGAVSSVEEHGYVMDLGITGSRVFMPKSVANQDIDLDVGQLTWCTVKSVTQEGEGCIVLVTNKLQSIQDSFLQARDGSNKTIDSLLPGTAVEFVVDKPLTNGIEGHIYNNIKGYIQRQHSDTVHGKKPRLGQKVRARVLYVTPTTRTPFFTMRPVFQTSRPDLALEQRLQDGDVVEDATVIVLTGRSVVLRLGKHDTGTISLKRIQVDEDLTDEEVIAKSYPPGSEHRVRILRYNLSDHVYSCSDQPALLNEKYFCHGDLKPGDLVDATVQVVNDSNILLNVGRLTGLVPQMHISDMGVFVDPKKASMAKLPKKKFKVGQAVRARVLSVSRDPHRLLLTLKPSLLDPDLELLTSYDQAVVGKSYKGYIRQADERIVVGMFNDVLVHIPSVYVSKEPVDNIATAFHVGQIVNCTILKVRPEKSRIIGSLTTAPFTPDDNWKSKRKRNTTEKDVKQSKGEHDAEPTKKTKVETVKKNKSKKSESSDEGVDLPEVNAEENEYSVMTAEDMALVSLDDCVTRKNFKKRVVSLIKAINNRTKRIATIDTKINKLEKKGIQPKNKKIHTAMQAEKIIAQDRIKILFKALKNAQEKLKEFPEEEKTEYQLKKEKIVKANAEVKVMKEDAPATESAKQNGHLKENQPEEKKIMNIKVLDSSAPVLEVPGVEDFWSASAQPLAATPAEPALQDLSSSDDEAQEQPKKKRKKLTAAEKVERARAEEERVRQLEQRAAQDATPRSADQFERLLLAQPGSSQLWIAYMAFHLQATEVDKARAAARRALTTIGFREEDERLNVWLALLNLEHRFGTRESQEQTLEEALQMNDTFKIHSQLLDIYAETSAAQELCALAELVLRKYRRQPQTYTRVAHAFYRLRLLDKARAVMQKAITVLEKKEHVGVIVQFALYERALGDGERAEALLEQVVRAHPARVDVWAVLADMLFKANDMPNVRQVMERAVSQKLPARRVRSLYQKWLQLEARAGDAAQEERVRQMALQYINDAKF